MSSLYKSFSVLLFVLLVSIPVAAQLPVVPSPNADVTYSAPPRPDSVFVYWKEKMLDYRQKKDLPGEAGCLQQMGQVLYQLGNYSSAIEKLLASSKIYRSINMPDSKTSLAVNFNLLGTVYYYSLQPAKATEQFQEALVIFSTARNYTGMANTYAAIGHVYEKKKDYDSAYIFQQTALRYAILGKDLTSQAKIYENIGSIYEDAANYDTAKYYFEKSLSLYNQTGELINSIEVINNLGDVYQKRGFYKEGLNYARRAMLLATGQKAIYQLQSAYRDMGQNFALMNQYDSAYHYIELSRALVQQIYTAESSQQIAIQETLYETEKMNTEIDRLQAARRINTILNISGGILIVMICMLAAVTISRQRLKIGVQKAINEGNQQVYETQKGLMESELKRQQLQEDNLQQQLQINSTQLSSHILHLIQKNEVMEEIKNGLTEIIKDDKRDQKKQVKQLLQKINFSFSQDNYWEEFRLIFDQVHQSFFTNLTENYPGLTPSELRLLSLIKMNLSSSDTATLLGITADSLRVNRYRVKKKLNLGQVDSLSAFIQSM